MILIQDEMIMKFGDCYESNGIMMQLPDGFIVVI
jgi:hypothetical protein